MASRGVVSGTLGIASVTDVTGFGGGGPLPQATEPTSFGPTPVDAGLGAVAPVAASRRLSLERTAAFGGTISTCPLAPRRNGGIDPPGGNSWAALAAISAHSNATATAPSKIHCRAKL